MATFIIKVDDIGEDELTELIKRAIADKKDIWYEDVPLQIIQVN